MLSRHAHRMVWGFHREQTRLLKLDPTSNSYKIIHAIINSSTVQPGEVMSSYILSNLQAVGDEKPKRMWFDKSSNPEVWIQHPYSEHKHSRQYIRQTHSLGSQLIDLTPKLFKVYNNGQLSFKDEKNVTNNLSNWHVSSKVKHQLGPGDISIQNLIALEFIRDPKECLTKLYDCINTEKKEKIQLPAYLGDILTELETEEPIIELNQQFLFHNGTDYTLPSIQDLSPIVNTLLIHLSVIDFATDKQLAAYLDNLSGYGNLLYKVLVRASILEHTNGHPIDELYYMLTNDAYLQFLVEGARVYDELIMSSKVVDALLETYPKDLYYRQFGQYFATLALIDLDRAILWTSTHVKNYVDILNNLTGSESNEFTRCFNRELETPLNYFEKVRLEQMRSILDSYVPEQQSPRGSHEELERMARSAIQIVVGQACWSYSVASLNKMKQLVVQAFEEKGVLQNIGLMLISDREAGIEELNTLIYKMLKKPPRKFDASVTIKNFKQNYGDMVTHTNLFAEERDNYLADLLSINYHVTRDFFRNSLVKRSLQSKYTDHIQKYSIIGYDFYEMCVTSVLVKSDIEEEYRVELKRLLMLKGFRTMVYADLDLPINESKIYAQIMKKRTADLFSTFKCSKTGFDQIMALLLVTRPDIVEVWIERFLADLSESRDVTDFRIPKIFDCLSDNNPGVPQINEITSDTIDIFNQVVENHYQALKKSKPFPERV